MTFVAGSKNLICGQSDAPPFRAALPEAFHRLQAGVGVMDMSRHQVGYRLAVAGDRNAFTALDRTQQVREMCLGLGGLDFLYSNI